MVWQGRQVGTGEAVQVTAKDGLIKSVEPITQISNLEELPWISPGWFDLQVNGFGGFDLNGKLTTLNDVAGTTKALHEKGVSTYLPTVITGSMERMKQALSTIAEYRYGSYPSSQAIAGIHLEGPYLSSEDGCRGAHPREFTRDPQWEEFQELQEAARGLIKMVTIAPERKGSVEFIEKLTASGVVTAIGHTMASDEELDSAIKAGATLCTHLGNGSQPMLPRHPNYIWNQLADDRLWATFVPDGHHLSPKVLKAMLRVKGKRSILVSDTTQFGGMSPGKYRSLIGGEVVLTESGRLHTIENPQILAGSAASLAEGVQNSLRYTDMDLAETIDSITVRPAQIMAMEQSLGVIEPGKQANLTMFYLDEAIESLPEIVETVVAGETVYRK